MRRLYQEKDNILSNVVIMGNYLLDKLKTTLAKHPGVIDIRGQGLMMGVELDRPCMELPSIGLKNKLLFNITANKVVRLLPPLIINQYEADEIVNRLDLSIGEFLA